ncbi:ABC transporter ATP-binding protein [Pseudolysinimonas kribbensis]|uniref:ABC transporter ATP-binding protein n=1 Tax=Pseudolysinimonas kribbensis TaxID=433641 RepID=UPI0031D35E75
MTFWYGSTLILDDVSCSIAEGEFVSVIGASGCGKSTLLQLLDGALRPGNGRVVIEGHDASKRDDSRAVVYQDFALMPWKTVAENVRLGLDYRRGDLRMKQREEIAHHYLDRIGLGRAAGMYPYQLSGGMKQRVGLARAFAVQPSILLMDEPFSALDAQNAEILREEVRGLVAEERRCVVFVTHNLDEALQLSDRILLMRSTPGRLAEDISLVEQKSDPVAWERIHYAEYRARLWEFLKGEVAAHSELKERS